MSSFLETLTSGTWELIHWGLYDVSEKSDMIFPWTKSCTGFLMYTPDQHVSLQIQGPNPVAYAAGPMQPTPEEGLNVAKGTLSYSGPFYISQEGEEQGKKAKLFHHMSVCVPPNWIGQTQTRDGEIREEQGEVFLYITADSMGTPWVDGKTRAPELKWRKVKSNKGNAPP